MYVQDKIFATKETFVAFLEFQLRLSGVFADLESKFRCAGEVFGMWRAVNDVRIYSFLAGMSVEVIKIRFFRIF